MTREKQLEALLAKVEAGDDSADVYGALDFLDQPLREPMVDAYNGSLDAALALHEAVLPEWGWQHGNQIITGDPFACVYLPDADDAKWRVYRKTSDNPARAWLIAIIKALISMEPEA